MATLEIEPCCAGAFHMYTSHSIRDSDHLENGSRWKFGIRGVIRYVRADRRMSPGTVLGKSLASKSPYLSRNLVCFSNLCTNYSLLEFLR